ncbi:1-acyl-sn-glycerol-3-phosphate acyltransferase [Acidihalobacter ferrooxydans]|uniref:Phospholipid/glycerol acyltransferase domain-containing protein n=1 Tax=Acidihalobacter ferrooxydans TaxID=1765967 RepID=A0A1P8UF45_9GAMM|nr:1-acyl-sn-glycerol-3-phosphate acyltransferase [Acidihalobacter ferrooxydans]APZ42470.1 hypothetical protein BW247_04680 [Acidihalobacter ferrooxydans]
MNHSTVRRQAPTDRREGRLGLSHAAGLVLGMLIIRGLQAVFRTEVHGAEHLRHAPGALVLSNHRRDSDGPLLGGVLMHPEGLRFKGVEPFFIAREDLFRPGFLGQYLQDYPRPLRLLRHLPLAGALSAIQLRPLRRIPEYSLGEVLTDVLEQLGDRPLAQTLRPAWVQRVAHALGRDAAVLRVSDALRAPRALRYQTHAFRRLTRATFRALLPYQRSVIAGQLQAFAHLVEDGATILLEPEGRISPDGRFHRPRQALHYLLNASTRTPHILPVAITYDFMRPGRTRVLVRFGPPLHGLSGQSRRATDATVARAVLGLWTVCASQLTGYYLLHHDAPTTRDALSAALAHWFTEIAQRCARLGVPLDPLLADPKGRQRRARECAAWSLRARPDRTRLEYLDRELNAIASAHPGLLDGDTAQ